MNDTEQVELILRLGALLAASESLQCQQNAALTDLGIKFNVLLARCEEAERERDKFLGALESANATAKRRGEYIAALEGALKEARTFCVAIQNNRIRMDVAMSTGDARRDEKIAAAQQIAKYDAALAGKERG